MTFLSVSMQGVRPGAQVLRLQSALSFRTRDLFVSFRWGFAILCQGFSPGPGMRARHQNAGCHEPAFREGSRPGTPPGRCAPGRGALPAAGGGPRARPDPSQPAATARPKLGDGECRSRLSSIHPPPRGLSYLRKGVSARQIAQILGSPAPGDHDLQPSPRGKARAGGREGQDRPETPPNVLYLPVAGALALNGRRES